MAQTHPLVRVRGETSREVEPEIAHFTLVTGAQDKDRRRTLERLSARNSAVLERVRSFGDAVETLESGTLNIRPRLRTGRGERVSGYHGFVRLRLTVNDFEALSLMIGEFADQELTEVQGPSWQLRIGSPVYRESRSQAVAAAVDRARTYAEALGGHVTGLVELADVGLSSRTSAEKDSPVAYGAIAQPGLARSAPTPAPEVEIEVPRITVRAEIEATFTMSEPTAL